MTNPAPMRGEGPEDPPPPLTQLEDAVLGVLPYIRSLAKASDGYTSHREGGDVARYGSTRTLVRHAVNYAVAAAVVDRSGQPARHLLDIGCGTGALSAWLANRLQAELHLHDTDDEVLRVAAKVLRPKSVTLQIADAPAVDLVTAFEVVEHLPHAAQIEFVKQAFAHVRPGGALVVSTPDETSYPFGTSAYPPHVGTLSLNALVQLLVDGTGQVPSAWRLEGGAFHLSAARRYGEWIGNHMLNWPVVQRAAGLMPTSRPSPDHGWDGVRRLCRVRFGDLTGPGTGLIAVVRRSEGGDPAA